MRAFFIALGGAAVGAATALLFAPATGRRTRALIRDKTARYTHQASDFVEKKSRHLKNKATGYAHQVAEVTERGREMLESGKATFQKKTGREPEAPSMAPAAEQNPGTALM